MGNIYVFGHISDFIFLQCHGLNGCYSKSDDEGVAPRLAMPVMSLGHRSKWKWKHASSCELREHCTSWRHSRPVFILTNYTFGNFRKKFNNVSISSFIGQFCHVIMRRIQTRRPIKFIHTFFIFTLALHFLILPFFFNF